MPYELPRQDPEPTETRVRTQVFTQEELAKTRAGQAVDPEDRKLERLRAAPVRNLRRIRAAKKNRSRLMEDYEEAVGKPSRENDAWHQINADAPPWAHKSSYRINRLYQELRGFDVVAESWQHSPGLEHARANLHHSQLDGPDRETLIKYFHFHEHHDCKDHSQPESTYWSVQARLDHVVSKIPPMDGAVTVWRGESYSTGRRRTREEKLCTVRRIHDLMRLKPGDIFSWDSCVATSLSLRTAAGQFSGSLRPEDFKRLEVVDASQAAAHSVLFELETDRGVFIDDELATAAPANEDEILLPRHMQFEVVGHSQLSADRANGNNFSSAYHLIKLRLPSK